MTSRSVSGYKVQYPEAVRKRCLDDFAEIMESGNLVLGRFTKEFEEGWAAHIGMPFAAAVQSDSAALEIALRLVGVDGKVVLMPCMSFFGCAEAAYRANGRITMIDVDIENGVFPSAQAVLDKVDKIGPSRVGAFLGVYTAGYIPGDIEKLAAGLKERNVPFIEDVAHCHGTKLNGRSAGSFGDMSCWSFFATKVLTTGGEGGMILSHDSKFIDRVKVYRNYGRGVTWGTGLAAVRGYNWRMTEFQAAVGCEILKDVPAFMEKRLAIAQKYDRLLAGQTLVQPVPPPPGVTLGYYRYIVLLPKGVDKGRIKKALADRNVSTQGDVYEVGLHEQPIYPELKAQGWIWNAPAFPNSEEWAKRHLCLPIHLAMNDGDEEYVCEVLLDAVRSASSP